jgi:hypothetical protein
MKWPEPVQKIVRVPKLTVLRAFLALAIALGADGLQLITGALGWAGPDQVIDLVAMVIISWLIGFHLLLLPTFVLELIPLVEDLPTWTACTIAVVILRWRKQRFQSPPATLPGPPLPPARRPDKIQP